MKAWSSRLLRFAVSAGLLAVVIWLADWNEIWSTLKRVDRGWVAAAFALAFLDRLVLTYRWEQLLRIRSLEVGFGRLLRIQLAANFLGSFLPSSIGVDAVRVTALGRSRYPVAEVIATTLVDRASLVVATLVFGSVMVVALAGRLLPENVSRLVVLVTVAAVAVCFAALHPRVRGWVRTALLRWLPEKAREHVAEIGAATLSYRHEGRRLLYVGGVTLLLFVVRLAFAMSLAYACGADVSFGEMLVVIPVLWILVMLPLTIGNIGLQDMGYVALMGLLGVPAAVAVSMSLLEHVATRVAALPGALFLSEVTGR